MEDAAHAESLHHEVYHMPLAVQPEIEYRKTPDNYRDSYFGADPLPAQIRVWRVQNTPSGNVLARGYSFADSPDAEVLAVGFNFGKEYGAVGIGRQASVLQWGYSDTPSQMTEAGRRLFINCIHYIRRCDGQTPLVRAQLYGRCHALQVASILRRIKDRKGFAAGIFPDELLEKCQSDPNSVVAYYQENLELIYWDRVYRVDNELKSLGLDSNRKVETLERLLALLDDPTHAGAAQRLLVRYTDCSSETSPQWRQWFAENKDRIYFTDIGGYKFQVVPRGYRTHPARP